MTPKIDRTGVGLFGSYKGLRTHIVAGFVGSGAVSYADPEDVCGDCGSLATHLSVDRHRNGGFVSVSFRRSCEAHAAPNAGRLLPWTPEMREAIIRRGALPDAEDR